MPRLSVEATVARQGWHRWPDAIGHRHYLASTHRHLFRITAQVEVSHDDREVEFHDLGDTIRMWWGDETNQHPRGSCEVMAIELSTYLGQLGMRVLSTRVSEDGECAAIWERLG